MKNKRHMILLAALCAAILLSACGETKDQSGPDAYEPGDSAQDFQAATTPAPQAPAGSYVESKLTPEGLTGGRPDGLAQRSDGSIVFTALDAQGYPVAYVSPDGQNWTAVDNSKVTAQLGDASALGSVATTVDENGTWWLACTDANGAASACTIAADGTVQDLSLPALQSGSMRIYGILQDGTNTGVFYNVGDTAGLAVLDKNGAQLADLCPDSGLISPCMKDGKVFVQDYSNTVHVYNADTGAEEQSYTLPVETALDRNTFGYTIGSDGTYLFVGASGIQKIPPASGSAETVIYDAAHAYADMSFSRSTLLCASDGSILLSCSIMGEAELYRYAAA